MADEAQQLKTIADNLQHTYQSLRKAASNISGLLQVGRATCDEVKAYNVWALAVYNTQKGMIATLRAAGQQVQDIPAPTYFTWRGTPGQDAWKLDCGGEAKSLSGLMGSAMRGVANDSTYLSTNEVEMVTNDPFALNPEASPSFATLAQLAQQREIEKQQQVAGLGIAPGVIIVIAVVTVVVAGVAINAIMQYLKTSKIEESNTRQTQLQAEAFANYTAARLSCYSQCVQQGKPAADCVAICQKIVEKPNIKIPGQDKPWGALQWIGFTVVAGSASILVFHLWKRHREGKPFIELPESIENAIHVPS